MKKETVKAVLKVIAALVTALLGVLGAQASGIF
ncbi:MAG: smalltalk protein [Prevotella sp.]|nr:smalltalk protein [Prevotella sp.]